MPSHADNRTVGTDDMPKFNSDHWWMAQINKGLEWRKKYSGEERWQRIDEYYQNTYMDSTKPSFNLIYTIGSSLIPALIYQSPHIVNTARRPEFIFWARFFDGIDNWLVTEMEVQEVFEDAVLTAYLRNTVGIQLGYDFDIEFTEEDAEEEFKRVVGTLDRSRKTNQPWLDLIDPINLVLAPGTKNMRNCPWFAKHIVLPTRILEKIKGLKNVEATHIPDEITKSGDGDWYESQKSLQGFTSFWEIHDAESRQFGWLTSDGKWMMPLREDPLQIDGLPLEVISFNKNRRSLFGTPDPLYVESQQLEGDETRYIGMLQRRSAVIKGFIDSELLDEDKIRSLLSKNPLTLIPVDLSGTEKKLSEALHLVQPHVQTEFADYEVKLLNDAQLILGIGNNQIGQFSKGRHTKFEAQVVEDRSILRLGRRRQQIADTIGKLYGRINQLIAKHWKAKHIAPVIGIEGAIHWVSAYPVEFKNIRAQLVTRVDVESLAPVSQERRKAEMVEVMGIVAQFAGQGLNVIPIVQAFLSKFPWLELERVLPQANNQADALALSAFQEQQQQLMGSPEITGQIQGNLAGLGQAIGRLPLTGGTENASRRDRSR